MTQEENKILSVFKEHFQILIRQRSGELSSKRSNGARADAVKGGDGSSFRYPIHREHSNQIGEDFFSTFDEIVEPNMGFIPDAFKIELIKSLNLIYDSSIRNLESEFQAFTASRGIDQKNLKSYILLAISIYTADLSTCKDKLNAKVSKHNLKWNIKKKENKSSKVEEIRRLSAIMFTDIVGYSALTQRNEKLALELLQWHAGELRTIFSKFRGIEIKTIGDAFLVEFSSALDAVECAIEIQTKLNEYNTAATNDRQLQLRIGIHLGDVVRRDNDIFGDGVNIAARIEPFAAPGGICISEDVTRQVRNKISYSVEPLSSHQLKNISLPVQLFAIQLPWQLIERRSDKTSIIDTKNLQRTTVAVLPFASIGRGSDDYFSEGMTEEIISSLSKVSGLDVIARTSAFKFKDSTLDVASIASQLGAGTILGGTVRRAGEKARISIRLMDAGSQRLLWSEDYTKDLHDIFTVQSDVAMQVASSLKVRLLASEEKNIHKQGTNSSESFQSYLLGRFYLNKRTGENIQRSIEHFQKSISCDANNALSYAGLAEAYTLLAGAGYGSVNKEEASQQAMNSSMKAIALDDSLAEAHLALAYFKFRIEWNWDEAEKEFLRTIELKQSFSKAHELYGLFLGIHRRFDEAFVRMKRALELDPLSAGVHTGYGRFLTFAQKYEEAHRSISQALELDPSYAEAHFAMGDLYLSQKNYEEALACTENALSLSGRRPIILGTVGHLKGLLGDVSEAEQILDELRRMDSPAQSTFFAQANVLAGLGRIEEAAKAMERAIETREGVVIFINADPSFFGGEEMKQRIKGMLARIGFNTTGL